ncbi:Protein YIPF6 [Porphyridium purpureum]|uniref:Protein YIPF n=1 Tax=Porphyridium purpureum TaxID=35688 RepID=A0A5J4YV94_PORPP|nr:Protein YIPF6 [Porphyridium purpureum]|eukprot:POR7304..scf227_4
MPIQFNGSWSNRVDKPFKMTGPHEQSARDCVRQTRCPKRRGRKGCCAAMSFDTFDSSLAANTLNEPVLKTVLRDVSIVGRRIWLVLSPDAAQHLRAELRDWELWGVLFISMSLATILSMEASHEASAVFSIVFLVVFLGSAVVTLNAQLLGAALSFFQTLCMLGYCVFPILLAALINLLWQFVPPIFAVLLIIATVVACCFWSMRAASAYLEDTQLPDGRKTLLLYPVLLFFFCLSWMVLISSSGRVRSRVSGLEQATGLAPAPAPLVIAPTESPTAVPSDMPANTTLDLFSYFS